MSKSVVSEIEIGLSVDAGKVISRPEDVKSESVTLQSNGLNEVLESTSHPGILEKNEELHLPCSRKKWKKLNILTSNHTKNLEALQSFLINENKMRKTDRINSLTKKLGQDQWKSLRNELNISINKCDKSVANKKTDKILGKSKNLLLCWLLYPDLKGMKPDNWKQIVDKFEMEM